MKKVSMRDYLSTISQNYFGALGGVVPKQTSPGLKATGKVALIVSPHPDDEAISGGLALRLKLELGYTIVNIPFSLGSKVERQKERLKELDGACNLLGFILTPALTPGQELKEMRKLLSHYKPDLIMTSHPKDGHKTHEQCSALVQAAMVQENYQGKVAFHEFWQAQANPNFLLELGPEVVTLMLEALVCHEGEVNRNPYHLRLPFWLADNSRRGSELVGGTLQPSSNLLYSVLLNVGKMQNSIFVSDSRKCVVAMGDDLSSHFG